MPTSLVIHAVRGWDTATADLAPGGYAAVLASEDVDLVGIEGRVAGLELRDTLLVLNAGLWTSFAFLFRKPLTEGTITQQALSTGTGGLHIDACRVGTEGGTKRSGQAPYPKKADGREDRSKGWARTGHEIVAIGAGRWPSNVVLVHGAGCKNVGTKSVKASNPTGQGDGSKHERTRGVYMASDDPNAFRGNGSRTFYGAGGAETVTAYECEPLCPVRVLDDQSDTSRFFPQFKDAGEMLAWITRLIDPV